MWHLNENYYLRNHFLTTNSVPTQSMMKKKMKAPLAAVYFKSMSPKLKVIAGLEPPLKGGGGDWYVPPEDMLAGRTVLKPVEKEYLSELNYIGIDDIGKDMLEQRLKRMRVERNLKITINDEKWSHIVKMECENYGKRLGEATAKRNTERIQNAFRQFTALYVKTSNTIEKVVFEAARSEIMKIQNNAFQKMQDKYHILIKQQATELYDEYEDKLKTEKSRLKAEFLEMVEKRREKTTQKLHDHNLEKHIAIEKLRSYLECRNLACQVFVALKEKERCMQEIETTQHRHHRVVRAMKEAIAFKDFVILNHVAKEKQRGEFNKVWKEKVKLIANKFQMFISYCLRLMPQHADFFLNIEKLMLLQLNETIENPSAESIILEPEELLYDGPVPKPKPFYLFCDRSADRHKLPIRGDLCPKQCETESGMPAIVINKRCIYAACDNFSQFTNKIKSYIHGKQGDDLDFADAQNYDDLVPVKYTSSAQLLELKLETSLLQVLQQELANVRNVPIECGECKVPYCFCTKYRPYVGQHQAETSIDEPSTPASLGNVQTRSKEIIHEREPKLESYMEYVKPRKCGCVKRTKKHLQEHLPVYMRTMSTYAEPELPHYEICPTTTLKELVRTARGYHTPPPPEHKVSNTRDVSTQCEDVLFNYMCECISDDEFHDFYKDVIKGYKMSDPMRTRQFQVVSRFISDTELLKVSGPDSSLELKQIFQSTGLLGGYTD
ncbi:unnamed protein product [Chrysodeixis includens]|uniref:Uncharacterized protein n=1 Tax=Chrysodeixis includens TaxID=689277 RepID=A0A9P0BTC7_CHRIL|nr:unnamed protein product [Chrysodeixis includens]